MAKDKAKIALHVQQWKHNRALIGQIPASHPDWIVTIVFYTAVHAIDAALAHEGVTVWNHDTRFAAIGGIPRMQRIGHLYHPLYDLSRKVRYTADPGQWIPSDRIEKQIIGAHLLPLEKSVLKLIGEKVELPAIDLKHLTAPAKSAS